MTEIDEADHTAELAGVLGLPASTFARTFGAQWHAAPGPTPHDFDSDPSGGLEAEVTPWFLGGSPPQLMARVFDHGIFLATPEGSWAGGTHTLVYRPAEQRYLAADELDTPTVEQLVRDLLRRRRSTFRYCRYCRRPTPPELRVEDCCIECAGVWEGVVF